VNPIPTKQWLIIGLSAFTSLAICAFLLVLIEVLDLSVRTPEKFSWTVGLPLLGMLNRVDTKTFNVAHYFNHQSTDEKVEMFKSLLRKLRFEIESLNAQIVLFTSPKKREGKTFVTLCVAYALSLVDKRVLIIDTNFKNNSLSKILNPKNEKYQTLDSKKARYLLTSGKINGPEDQESKSERFEEGIYDLITPTAFNNVFVVTNSGGSDSPAEIFSGKNFKRLIRAYADSFDYIFLEGASINEYSDTKELIEHVDKVVAVFGASNNIKSIDKRSITFLKSIKEKFGGAVLNMVDEKDLKL
jgi:Mrp family chromosome partitioning ATPase